MRTIRKLLRLALFIKQPGRASWSSLTWRRVRVEKAHVLAGDFVEMPRSVFPSTGIGRAAGARIIAPATTTKKASTTS
jgi:hypothetical protein